MEYIIRPIREDEIHLLDDFLYEAIFIPEWYKEEVPRNIIYEDPKVYASIKDFGLREDDYCLVAEVMGKVIGAVWVRTTDEYGHIDDETPSFSISLYKEYRNKGIGTALMEEMLKLLKKKGYKKVSLGVNKENYAVRMYKKVGFEIVGDGDNESEWLMVCWL